MAKNIKSIPNTLHLYWGKDKPLSWLRWLTVKSFAMLNPDWQVIVWHPSRVGLSPRWRTREHSYYVWTGEDWFNRLAEAGSNVEVRQAPLDDLGFPPMAEVHRSDLFRWWLLHEMGGFWSDIDIVYYRPMSDIYLDMGADVLLCWGEIEELKHWQAIGFLAGKEGNSLFRPVYEAGMALAKAPNLGYQDLGTDLLLRFARPGDVEAMGSRISQIPQHVVYPFSSVAGQKKALWQDRLKMDVRNDTIGVHWFAAQKESCFREGLWTGIDLVTGNGGVGWAIDKLGLTNVKKKRNVIKYSIIMPYIDRPELLHNTLLSYHHWYGGRDDWEVVLVQDSKCTDPVALEMVVNHWASKGMSINLLYFNADKFHNPAPLFDMGARAARGDYFVLTNPEQFHDTNILSGFDEEFSGPGRKYVVAACKDRTKPVGGRLEKMKVFRQLKQPSEKWRQHSIYRPTLYHWCSALSKEDYFSFGGFDPAYAEGFCFDDDDFRESVIKSGVEVVQRDDLITSHQWHGSCQVPDKMARWNRNKALYESKHGSYRAATDGGSVVPAAPSISNKSEGSSVAVMCVLRSGGSFTKSYVSKLKAMVKRNTTVGHDFICLTDLPDIPGSIQLDDDLPGWWSKLELFRPGITNADRIVYFDLDTLILANIDDLLALDGGFYGLRPWNRTNRLNGQFGSGIMSWKTGDFDFVYNEFNRDAMSPHEGDQAYISRTLTRHGIRYEALQDHVRGIYSYKRECRHRLPHDARVVCFHGRPRIHECQDKWVREAWG